MVFEISEYYTGGKIQLKPRVELYDTRDYTGKQMPGLVSCAISSERSCGANGQLLVSMNAQFFKVRKSPKDTVRTAYCSVTFSF